MSAGTFDIRRKGGILSGISPNPGKKVDLRPAPLRAPRRLLEGEAHSGRPPAPPEKPGAARG
jgi:hypothetical protein